MKISKKQIAVVLGLGVIILAGFYWDYQHELKTPIDSKDTTNISFQVKKGATASEIGMNLEKKELIKSATTFYLYTKFNGLDKKIISGRFLLNKTMTIPEIVTQISDPKKAQNIITIQEGLRIKDIDKKLVDLELISASDFVTAVKNFGGWKYYTFLDQATLEKLDLPLEGYIYPDTYFLDYENFNSKDLINMALDNFEKKTAELIPQIKKHTVQEIIIMASIIENEVTTSEDRKIVSGILWKRLESGWMLGADATLLYTKDDRKITDEDLASDNPYNTRKVKGLPPGPISNPSIDSIEAAMYPESSSYWFYLTTKDGETVYAKTNDEQNTNIAKYL